MKEPKQLLLMVFCGILSACSSIYMPGVPNTPMLNAQGEFAGGAHVSLRGNLNFNAAYAITDHLAITANAGSLNTEGRKKDIKHRYFEMGAGYFKNFGIDSNRIFEVYTGLAWASNQRTFRQYQSGLLFASDYYDADYSKIYIQANYSSKDLGKLKLFGKSFELNYGTAWRISFATTERFYINGQIQNNEDNIFIEPVFFTRIGLDEHFQLQYTGGSNFGLKNRKYLNAGYSVSSFGIIFNVGHRK
jgi:hypothetical protein